ncbi:MAG TPA: Ada metal-binding domain-containing protein [Dehalococcoidia bacterium]|nr:Ada metal-binding domain-containing protein [Dehalococcoidia bacterium]
MTDRKYLCSAWILLLIMLIFYFSSSGTAANTNNVQIDEPPVSAVEQIPPLKSTLPAAEEETAAPPSNDSRTGPASEKMYVGSINSNKYHLPECKWAKEIIPSNQIWFSSRAEAEAKGYVPCKVCKP